MKPWKVGTLDENTLTYAPTHSQNVGHIDKLHFTYSKLIKHPKK